MTDPNTLDLAGFWEWLSRDGRARRLLELAREEDLDNSGDLTARVMGSSSRTATAMVRARAEGVAAGLASVPMLLEVFGGGLGVEVMTSDGQRFRAGDTLAVLTGDLASIVTVERTLLNLLGRMCGVATLTRRYVDEVAGTRARILDTRKTTPGLRAFEKYAVRCGGGTSHRLGLFDAVLIKDNHIAGLGGAELAARLTEAARAAKSDGRARFIEVEVDTPEQFTQVLAVERGLIDIALLDNMDTQALRDAVRRRDDAGSPLLLEASGGVRLDTVRAIAATGVDRISVGALTHSAVTVDLGLDID